MEVTDRHGQRVGDVVRRGRSVETQEQLDHLLDLDLLCTAVADDRALDLGGCVFDDRNVCLPGREDGDASCMPEEQRRPSVGRVEDVLDDHAVRLR
jgi:hypothetical protein